MRGIPLRVEIGPKDLAKDTLALARRDIPGKEGKSFITQGALAGAVGETLAFIQKALYDRAAAFREAKTVEGDNHDDFKSTVESGFAFSFWCGDPDCEQKIKEETKATLRCIPIERPSQSADALSADCPHVSGRTSPRSTDLLINTRQQSPCPCAVGLVLCAKVLTQQPFLCANSRQQWY